MGESTCSFSGVNMWVKWKDFKNELKYSDFILYTSGHQIFLNIYPFLFETAFITYLYLFIHYTSQPLVYNSYIKIEIFKEQYKKRKIILNTLLITIVPYHHHLISQGTVATGDALQHISNKWKLLIHLILAKRLRRDESSYF